MNEGLVYVIDILGRTLGERDQQIARLQIELADALAHAAPQPDGEKPAE